MKSSSRFLFVLSVFLVLSATLSIGAKSASRDLAAQAQRLRIEMQADHDRAWRLAAAHGWPTRVVDENGSVTDLQGLDHGWPVYYTTHNLKAAITLGADRIWPGGVMGYTLGGGTQTIGVWEGGAVFVTHQEFSGRVTQQDAGMDVSQHATQVSGTLVAAGLNPAAKGLAFQAHLRAYDWTNDLAEMTAEAAQGLLFSNHSYGPNAGWQYNSFGDSRYVWFGDPSISLTEDYRFGYYLDRARQWDDLLYQAPDYLVCASAGNDRLEDGNYSGQDHWIFNGSQWLLSSQKHDRDGGIDGFDCINGFAVAKNVLTVGSAKPLLQGYSSPADVFIDPVSSNGPTDDGRIKPDVVADGVSVVSCSSLGKKEYLAYSGTSAATPGVTGALALLREHLRNLYGNIAIRSATLKALVLHTARETGPAPGPDYRGGWGLMDVARCVALVTEDYACGGNFYIRELLLISGGSLEFDIESDGIQPLRATICWTDPPGPELVPALDNPAPVLINDLDLRLTGPNGMMYYPWILDPAHPDAAAGTGDNIRDNVEQVHVAAPMAGKYRLHITSKGALTGGSQPVSLIVSGNVDRTAAAPAQPMLTAPVDGAVLDADSTVLFWTKVPNAISYTLDLAYDDAFSSIINHQDDMTTPSLSVSGLYAETEFFWRARAKNSGGFGVWSKTGHFCTSRQAILKVWNKVSTPEMDEYINDIVVNKQGEVFVSVYDATGVMFSTLHRSIDGGSTWRKVNDAFMGLEIDSQGRLFGFFFDKIYSLGTDGTGKTFYQNIDHKDVTTLCVDNQDRLFAGQTGGKILYSADHGASWSFYSQVPVSADNRTINLSYIDGVLYAATYGEGVFCSSDQGVSWRKLTGGISLNYTYCIAKTNDGHLLVGTTGGIYRSALDPINWVQIQNGVIEKSKPTTILVTNCGVIYASSYGCAGLGDGVFISLDQGLTWSTVNAGLKQISTTVVCAGPSDELYVGNGTGNYAEGGSVYRGSQELAVESTARLLGLTTPAALLLTEPAEGARIAAADVHLQWQAAPEACRYEVQVSIYPDFSFVAFSGKSESADITIARLPECTAFNWRARVVTAKGYGIWSTARILTTTRLTAVDQQHETVPDFFGLEQNRPNPFNAATTIGFSVKERCNVLLQVYDLLGRKVATLVDEERQPGFYRTDFDASGLTTGVYLYRMRMGDFTDVKKLMLLR